MRHLENVLLERQILKYDQLRTFKRDVADAVLFALDAYEHDFYYDNVEQTSALLPIYTTH